MHIVIFTGGTYPQPELAQSYFSDFPPDYVLAADSGLETLEVYRAYFSSIPFTPSQILGDMDSLSDEELLEKYKNVPQKRFIVDKDYTDTELALDMAHQKLKEEGLFTGEGKITLVGAGGGTRLDHFLGVFDLFSTELRPDVWLSGFQSAYFIRQGEEIFITGLSESDNLSISRLSFSRTGGKIESDGLLWESPLFRKEGMPSISNRIKPEYVVQNKPCRFLVKEGQFLLILPTVAKVEIKSLGLKL